MRIMGLDPGGTTGVAIYDDEAFCHWERYSLGPEPHHTDLFYDLQGETEIVYEDFIYQRREIDKGVSLSLVSVEYIGIIKLYEQDSPPELPVTLVKQSPSNGKNSNSFWDDDKLKQLGLWTNVEHERDATRHILYYVSFTLNDRRFLDQLKK